ncbi:MAG TPA: ABC transporter ATP-binding protein [Candidatus Eisenbacteria bacterium]|jgi:ABC-type lipoprotein export system ATPase subunit|nr:ABC transporter ATP-binding protein [Candidatus Eisenbacteria bacterium]
MSEFRGQTSIEANGISRVYWDGTRRLQVLKGVELTVKKGEGISIWGPSGSGKTTLLNVLSGLDRPDEGQVRLGGADIHRLDDGARAAFLNRHVGFIFQFYHLLPEFTALENVMLPALIGRMNPKEARRRAESLLERLGLKERFGHFTGELSGGEQQRVAIARALVNDPEILFCDEPTGNLDPGMASEIVELLRQLFKKDYKTVLIVTHDERIAKMTDRTWSITTGTWAAESKEKR